MHKPPGGNTGPGAKPLVVLAMCHQTPTPGCCLAKYVRGTLMGRQIILKWSYLMIFMRDLVAVIVRWCKVYA